MYILTNLHSLISAATVRSTIPNWDRFKETIKNYDKKLHSTTENFLISNVFSKRSGAPAFISSLVR